MHALSPEMEELFGISGFIQHISAGVHCSDRCITRQKDSAHGPTALLRLHFFIRETYARAKSHAATPCGRPRVEDTLNVYDYPTRESILE
jgi:hypothetical protein